MMWGGSGDSFLWVFVMSVPTHARLPWPPNVNRTRITHDGLAREKELSNVVSDNSILLCIQLTWLRQDNRIHGSPWITARRWLPRPDEFLGSLLLNLSSLDASHLSVCARRLRLVQDASEQSQEMVRHGNVRLADGRPPLSIAAFVGWRSARLGRELGALRVTSWLRLGIPGNVLCMPMQWIRTNASLLTLKVCVLQRCFVPSRRFFVSSLFYSSTLTF
jgi:hypothetical protein